MAITLQQAKAITNDEVTNAVIDEICRKSYLLGNIQFDDAVYPAGNGGALSYSYYRLGAVPSAAFRGVNENFEAQTINKTKHNVDLKMFGGSFNIDRVIAKSNLEDEVDFQAKQMVEQTIALFNDTLINGDTDTDDAFDGLEAALTGTSSEFNKGSTSIDLSTANSVDTNYHKFLDMLDQFILGLNGKPTALLGNTALISKIRACARRTNAYGETIHDLGVQAMTYDGIPIIDMGKKSGSTNPVCATTSGVTSLYAVRLDIDALHAISMKDSSPVKVWLPDFNTAGAVKQGEIEMTTAIALKKTDSAGIFRNIKVG